MNDKKRQKRIAHAEIVFQRDQLRAATAAEQLNKAAATVEQYRGELTDAQFADVMAKMDEQKKDLEQFLLKARNKYVAKLKELGDPTLTELGVE